MDDRLDIEDVTGKAEDNEELKRIFKEKVRHCIPSCGHRLTYAQTKLVNCEIGSWIPTRTVTVKGPYKHIVAVVIKIDKSGGAVKVFRIHSPNDHRVVRTFTKKEQVFMVLLQPNLHYFWLMDEAHVKLISSGGEKG